MLIKKCYEINTMFYLSVVLFVLIEIRLEKNNNLEQNRKCMELFRSKNQF